MGKKKIMRRFAPDACSSFIRTFFSTHRINHNYVLSHSFNSICVYFSYNSRVVFVAHKIHLRLKWKRAPVVMRTIFSSPSNSFVYTLLSNRFCIVVRCVSSYSFFFLLSILFVCDFVSITQNITRVLCTTLNTSFSIRSVALFIFRSFFFSSLQRIIIVIIISSGILLCVVHRWNYKCKCYFSKQTRRVKCRVYIHF